MDELCCMFYPFVDVAVAVAVAVNLKLVSWQELGDSVLGFGDWDWNLSHRPIDVFIRLTATCYTHTYSS